VRKGNDFTTKKIGRTAALINSRELNSERSTAGGVNAIKADTQRPAKQDEKMC